MHSHMGVQSDNFRPVEQPIFRNMTLQLAAYLPLLQA